MTEKNRIEITDEIRKVVAETLNLDASEITPESRFVEDLGADSLDRVSLVMALEDKFKRAMPEEKAGQLKSVQDVVNLITTGWGDVSTTQATENQA